MNGYVVGAVGIFSSVGVVGKVGIFSSAGVVGKVGNFSSAGASGNVGAVGNSFVAAGTSVPPILCGNYLVRIPVSRYTMSAIASSSTSSSGSAI